MSKTRWSAAVLLIVGMLQGSLARPDAASQDPAPGQDPARPLPAAEAAAPQGDDPQQPTFRGGINFVRVDVIVTDRKAQPVTDLTQADFEVLEDGKPQAIEQFRLIKVDGNPGPDDPRPREVRTRADEEAEAARDDVRVFAIFLDDYHVRQANSISIRDPLTRFIETYLGPNDLVGIMYPLMPVSDVSFTRNHASILRAIQQFDGRKFDYTPRNQFEENYARYPTEQIERIRNDIVMGALEGLAVRLGSLREGRKSIIFVSEGFTGSLPAQLRRSEALAPADPRQVALPENSQREITREFFSQSDINNRMRDVYAAANRNNASIYALDPRGLAPFEYDIGDGGILGTPGFETDQRALQRTQDTLRTLAEETDGRAIVNRNSLLEGLAQIVRDSSFYYLIGYSSSQPATDDGKFHRIDVRVKRRDVEVRARKGYWAASVADVTRSRTPTPEVAKPIQQALASIAPSVQAARYVRTWVGTERAPDGRTRVTFVWEPLPAAPGARREQAGRISLLAADGRGDLVFRGRSPDAALASNSPQPVPNDSAVGGARAPGAAASAGPQRIVFDAPPGTLELRMTVEAAGSGGTLDNETRSIEIPDLTKPQAALSTPRVFRARNAREVQAVVADPNAIPVAAREFSRTERLLIRFDTYAAGSEVPSATATLLNRAGQKMSDVPVTPEGGPGAYRIDLGLSSIPAGEYLIEIAVDGSGGGAKELLAFRVGS